MMKLRIALLLVTLLGMLAAPAAAEFYRYIDERGVTRFTDNLAEVPPEQRPEVQTYTESPSSTAAQPAVRATAAPAAKTGGVPHDSRTASAPAADPNRGSSASLQKMQAVLQQEHAALKRERDRLLRDRETLEGSEQIAAFKAQAADLNRRIADYEQRLQAFAREAAGYNTEP
jgi:hypothetical protein